MIEVTPQRLKEFSALSLVGVGGISIVFSAVHLAAYNSFNNDRNVALKFVWDVEQARQEVRRLLLLDSNRGVNKLYGYFEAPRAEVLAVVAPLLSADAVLPEPAASETLVGVLVMQLSKGRHLMKTTSLEGGGHQLKRDEWVIDYDGKPYLQSLAIPLSRDERIGIIRSLIKVILEAHEQEPPQVHGDLHPGNVHFDTKTAEVVVLDWSGLDIYGAAGWITPWHDQHILGEIPKLPKKTDVYMIALWVERLLGNELRAFRRLAQTVLNGPIEAEYEIGTFYKAFEKIVGELQPAARRVPWKWALAVACLLALVMWQGDLYERYRDFNRIGELHERERDQNRGDAVVQAKAEDPKQVPLELSPDAPRNPLVKYDLVRPQAVYVSKRERFIVYGGLPFVEGDLLNNEVEIRSITLNSISLSALGVWDTIQFVSHPLLENGPTPDGCFLIYDTRFRDIVNAVSRQLKRDIVLVSSCEPVSMGLVYSDDPEKLLPRLFGIMVPPETQNKKQVIYCDDPFIRYWDLKPGMVIEGRFQELIKTYLSKRMGYDIKKIPAKLKDLRMSYAVTAPISCLDVFKQQVEAQGYTLMVDPSGTVTIKKIE